MCSVQSQSELWSTKPINLINYCIWEELFVYCSTSMQRWELCVTTFLKVFGALCGQALHVEELARMQVRNDE